MFNKSFISLYVCQDFIQVLELDGKKKRVKKHLSIELPSGIIKNYRIQDTSLFTQILKKIWKDLGLREKFVGIIVPEYSTLVKLLDISNVTVSEIAEAVDWQLAESLPNKIEDYVFDWKIIKKEKDIYKVLVVAIEKADLDKYLLVCEDADLYPVIVETPSLALTRLISDNEISCLLSFVGEKETFFVIYYEGAILGSSVVSNSNFSEMIKTAKMMLSHYKQVKVSKVVLCGLVNDSLIKEINENLQLPVEVFQKGLRNISEKESNNYLIPISSQMQEPDSPDNPFTLNLLPNDLVKNYKNAKLRLQVWSLTLSASLFIWMAFIMSLFSYFFINDEIRIQNQKLSQTSMGGYDVKAIIQNVKEANDLSGKIVNIKSNTVVVTQLINDIYKNKPEGISIFRHKIDLDNGEGEIRGVAETREALLEFRENLKNVSQISSVEVPISNFEEGLNTEFSLRFIIPSIKEKVKSKGVIKNVK